ncbi:hypothetical protein, partial [uncultured Fibrobacter sp.]|uniref:hypothetical protein n=1 Tax=uncultured Fibrobacter sp. TaxID=261512 RepID=UPI0025D96717
TIKMVSLKSVLQFPPFRTLPFFLAGIFSKAIENNYTVYSKSYQAKPWNDSPTEFLCEID